MSLRGPCVVRWLIGVCDADLFSLCCTHRTTAAVCHLDQRAAFTNFHGSPELESRLKGPETLRGRIMSRRGVFVAREQSEGRELMIADNISAHGVKNI